MQQQSQIEQNQESRIIEQNNLREENNYILKILEITHQKYRKKNSKFIKMNPDELSEAIKHIKKLWDYCSKLEEKSDRILKNQEQQPYSSIIISQLDNSSMQQKEDVQNQFIEKHLQEDRVQVSPSINNERQIKIQSINNIIQEVNEKMAWLDNIIKSSSLLSNKQSDHSKLSEVEFDLYQEQGKVKQQEDSQNQEDNHSNASTVEKFKSIPTPEELRAVKVLYKTIVQNLEENSQIYGQLQISEYKVKKLRKIVDEQFTMISRLQNDKRYKNYELQENGIDIRKKLKHNPGERADTLFNRIKCNYDEIIKLTQINQEQITQKTNQQRHPRNKALNDQIVTLSVMDLNKIQQSSQSIVEIADILQNLVYERDQKIGLLEIQAEDYKYFIIMGVLERESQNLPRLSQIRIQQLWENLYIRNDIPNIEIVKILQFNQQTYFKWQDYEDPEIFWASFNERQSNLLQQINVLLTNLIKIQKKAINLLSINNRIKLRRKDQLSFLQFIEKDIQYSGLGEVKRNIQLIVDSIG